MEPAVQVKKRTQQAGAEEAAKAKNTGPKTFVFWRGKHGVSRCEKRSGSSVFPQPGSCSTVRQCLWQA